MMIQTHIAFLLFYIALVQIAYTENQLAAKSIPPIPLISKMDIDGWKDFKLGKSYEDIAKLFEENHYNLLIPKEDLYPDIIEIEGESTINIHQNDFFERFQMKFTTNKRLYFIQMKMSKHLFSFNGLYERLEAKYGPAQIVRFKKITWTNNIRKLTLHRDNTLKYIALDQFPVYTNSPSFSINQITEDIKASILEGM